MGLTLKSDLFKEAYFRITSYELHRDKNQVRVRMDVFPSVEIRKKEVTCDWYQNGNTEIKLCEKEFRNYKQAEKKVKDSEVKKVSDKMIKEAEEKLKALAEPEQGLKVVKSKSKLSAEEKKSVFTNAKNNIIATEAKLLGSETIKALFKDLDTKNSLETLYKYLKKTETYMAAKDK